MKTPKPLLQVEDLTIRVSPSRGNGLSRSGSESPVLVSNLSLSLYPQQRVGLVGKSGSGKSVTAFALSGVYREKGLALSYKTLDVPPAPGAVTLIFQDPKTSLNPFLPVKKQFSQLLRYHNPGYSRSEILDKTTELLHRTGITDIPRVLTSFPSQLSGGQCQRIAIALALVPNPQCIIADEPTSNVDVGSRNKILDLLLTITSSPGGPALLFISHDLPTVQKLCPDVYMMEDGVMEKVKDLNMPVVPGRNISPEEQTLIRKPILEMSHVQYTYPNNQNQVLQDINLTITEGEFIGILGESGCGKTTLLHLAMGLLFSDPPGTICYQGNDLSRMTHEERSALFQKTQIVFQDPLTSLSSVLPNYTHILEPLELYSNETLPMLHNASLMGFRDVELDSKEIPYRFPHELSGGQRQRIAIARSLCVTPKIIFADEPVSALDTEIRSSILSLLLKLHREKGFAVVLVTHDLDVLRQTSTRILVMHGKTIVEDSNPAAFFGPEGPSHEISREFFRKASWNPPGKLSIDHPLTGEHHGE